MKKQLRKHMKSTRTPSALVDEKVCEKLVELVGEHSNLGLYMALSGEIKLDRLIDELFHRKNLYFPYVIKTKPLKYRLFLGWDQMETDEAGIPVPIQEQSIDPMTLDCVIMPCLGASTHGFRLGYGGGYYDRTFATYQGVKIGVTYEATLVEEDFSEPFDVRLDYIVTEERIITIGKK